MFEIEINGGDRDEVKVLKLILHELRHFRRILEPKFTLHITQSGEFMAAITAGQSASFGLSATASDNSAPVISNPVLTADDPNVTIAADSSDPSGLTFTVTVPASDTATSFNLDATAEVSSNTSPTPQKVSATLGVTISPAAQPVTFTLSINEK